MKSCVPGSFLVAFSALSVLGGVGCTSKSAGEASSKASESVTSTVKAVMDPAVDPCQDFYQYACGGWLKTTPLPADRPSWGRSFDEIGERNREFLRTLLEKDAPAGRSDRDMALLADYYASCSDEAKIEALATEPLKPWLNEIASVKDMPGLMKLVARMHMLEMGPLFAFGPGQDYANPDLMILHAFQGGIGLPERDFYLRDDETSVAIRTAYQEHVEKMLVLIGDAPDVAKGEAQKILAFETELAKASRPMAELRAPENRYHKIDLEGLKTTAPHMDWDSYLAELGSPGFKDINVASPDFLKRLDELMATPDWDTLRAYLRWQVVDGTATLLNKAVVEQNFAFNGQMLSGQKELSPRWKRCVNSTGMALSDAMSRGYIQSQFPGDSKAISRQMVGEIEAAFEASLPELDWMDDATRERAREKVHAITNKIGYPDSWRDYSSVTVKVDTYFENALALRMYESRRALGKLGHPVDKTEWNMPAFWVNAYYSPPNNEIVFPAGILQAPFFSRDFPMAMNFGGIGMVMGHELSHGFDDQGRKFDARGQLAPWWADDAVIRFEEAASCIEKQYGAYQVAPDVFVNGKLTLGENIADNGGIKSSYNAFKAWEAKTGTTSPVMDGFTNDQLFFVAFAQTWCALSTPEAERLQVQTDPHSPDRFRVNGPLMNFTQFAQAFQCKEGAAMAPAERCEVW